MITTLCDRCGDETDYATVVVKRTNQPDRVYHLCGECYEKGGLFMIGGRPWLQEDVRRLTEKWRRWDEEDRVRGDGMVTVSNRRGGFKRIPADQCVEARTL